MNLLTIASDLVDYNVPAPVRMADARGRARGCGGQGRLPPAEPRPRLATGHLLPGAAVP